MAELQYMTAAQQQAVRGNMGGSDNHQNQSSPLLMERDEGFTATSLSSAKGRNLFIRKVFSLTAIMLATTAAFVTYVAVNEAARAFLEKNIWLVIVCFILSIASILVLGCIPGVARSVPINYIFLLIFTLSESVIV